MHKLPIYEQDIRLPHAEYLGDHGFLLPTYSSLTEADVDEISEALARIIHEG
jgi:dTDP-4-amino-4,6-dideoxygalactose transaminase